MRANRTQENSVESVFIAAGLMIVVCFAVVGSSVMFEPLSDVSGVAVQTECQYEWIADSTWKGGWK